MLRIKSKGNYKKTKKFLENAKNVQYFKVLDYYGKIGLTALKEFTPVDTGLTRDSWDYHIEVDKITGKYSVVWTNSNVQGEWCPIAIIIQYGHASRNGSWVEGIDYINPALYTVFEDMRDEIWKEVTNA